MKLIKSIDNVNEIIQLYETVFRAMPVGIVLYDESGECYFTTKKTVRLIGANKIEDILSQNFHKIDSWKESGLYEIALKAIETDKTLKFISNIKTSFGKNIWLEVICTSFEDNSKKNLFILISDVSEIKNNEQFYKEQSLFDSLTGIHNRRCFDERIDEEIQRCTRSGEPFSLILIDIDFFKLFNDNYGHLAGDECLKYIANEIKNSLTRKSDCVARYGGEEFICMLPYTDEKGALIVAEKIKGNIENLQIPHEKSKVHIYVTVSQGVCTQQSNYSINKKTFTNNTDNALYYAKKQGRNRIEVFKWL